VQYHPEFGSIFSTDDATALIPDDKADALILEEPEHLNWWVGHSLLYARVLDGTRDFS
jgi:hypothetical protein